MCEAGEIAQWLGAFAALTQDQSLVPRTHIGQFTTTYNSSFGGFMGIHTQGLMRWLSGKNGSIPAWWLVFHSRTIVVEDENQLLQINCPLTPIHVPHTINVILLKNVKGSCMFGWIWDLTMNSAWRAWLVSSCFCLSAFGLTLAAGPRPFFPAEGTTSWLQVPIQYRNLLVLPAQNVVNQNSFGERMKSLK